jgi:hypothetical protein
MKTKCIITFGVFLLVLMAGPAFADTFYVCPWSSYSTIQEAVDAAGPWDTVIVCPGDYPEDVLIQGNRDGLTVMSKEIPDCGPNTTVKSFSIGFASHSDHPKKVTIKGFTVTPCKDFGDGGVGIESSTDYNTIAFNFVYGCSGPPAGAAIRVNAGNDGNTVHHNLVGDCLGVDAGIKTEVDGKKHNIHHNCVVGCDLYSIWVYSDRSQVHQNQIQMDDILAGIQIEGDHNQAHHNEVCDGEYSDSIELFFGSEYNYVHHNIVTGMISDSNPLPSTNREKKNDEGADCPFYVCDACNGAALIWEED